MPAIAVETSQRLSLDGPIGPLFAAVLAIALLSLCGWSLWRERSVLGHHNVVLFWLLRTGALLVIVWMLLAPVNQRVETSTTRRNVAIMTDVSGSMQTVDPLGMADELRWAAPASPSEALRRVQAADAALAASGIAAGHIRRAADLLWQNQPEQHMVDATASANVAIQRVKENLLWLATAADGEAASLSKRVLRDLEAVEFEELRALGIALARDRTPAEKGWRESFPDLQFRVAAIRRSLQDLARTVVIEETAKAASREGGVLAAIGEMPRLRRVAGVVESIDKEVLPTVREQASVRFGTFDMETKWLSDTSPPHKSLIAQPSSQSTTTPSGTDLAAALQALGRDAAEEPIAAVFLFTDAAHNQRGSDPREVAATLHEMPVYVVPIGNTQHVRDVRLQAVSAPAVAMRNDDIVIEATVQAYDCEHEVGTVQLLQDGEMIDFRELTFDSNFATRTVRFEHRVASMGRQSFQLAAVPLDGELTEQNNFEEVDVEVTRSDIQVLLADELPRWEYRYLTQLFRRDDKVACDELLFHPRVIATGRRQETQSFPTTVDQWDQYDVVMLGDIAPEHLPLASQESLVQYLKQRGGTLVLIAGQESMPQAYADHPLGEILPVTTVGQSANAGDGGFRFQVTDEGQTHHALMIAETEEATRIAWDFVNRHSPLPELSPWRRPLPLARTLISAVPLGGIDTQTSPPQSAFLCWQPIGRGRVVYLSGPDTYRLRFLRGDRLHYRFWGQLLRWAIASELTAGTEFVRIRTDKSRFAPDEAIRITVRLFDAEGHAVVAEDLEAVATSQDRRHTFPLAADPLIPGEYHADARSLPPGVYRIEPVGAAITALQPPDQPQTPSTSITVQAALPSELLDTRSDRALAQQIADITGGQVIPPTAVAEVLRLTQLEPIVSQRVERQPLWLKWKYLWLVFGCLQTEWVIRKWKGLS